MHYTGTIWRPPYKFKMANMEIMNTNIFRKLKDIGMNCGMEYTKFEIFENCKGVSRFDHSVGVALITYHFTHDKNATVAALMHDIATPVFAHVIAFLNHDYENQESTEEKTKEIIKKWKIFCNFSKVNISPIEKENYLKIKAKHRYINPLVNNERVIDTNRELSCELEEYLNDDFNRYVKAI